MNHIKLPVNGIDEPIQLIQTELYDQLRCTWQLDDVQYDANGRVYKNPSSGGYVPEAYRQDSDYEEVLLDDKFAVQSFFGEGDETKIQGAYNLTQLHIIFMVNLGDLSTLPTRADAEVRAAVQAIIGENLHGFTAVSIITGIAKAFEGYTIGGKSATQFTYQTKEGVKLHDMHPWHCFRINGILRWDKPQRSNELPDIAS